MSYASDALLKVTVAKVAELEARMASLSAGAPAAPLPPPAADDGWRRKIEGEIQGLKMRMGKKKD